VDNEIIYSLGADSDKYPSIFQAVNKWRNQAGISAFVQGEEIVVHAGQLHPSHENQIRSQIDLPLVEVPEVTNTQPQKQDKPKKARKSNYGRWEMLNNWVDFGQHYFSTAAGRIWLAIFRMADGNTNVLEFSVRTLASKAGVTNKATQKAVTAFVKAGVLVCIFKSKKPGTPSKYRLADATNELTKRPAKPR
jgi:hypothetical protein